MPVTIGRADDNVLTLAGDDFASSHHARVEGTRDGVWLLDLDSTNGTLVDGKPVDGRKKLEQGSIVRIGDTELRLEL